MNVLVVVPTYDEAGTIQTLLQRVLDAVPHVDVLVVDDGSPDGTADLVAAVAAGDKRVHLLRRDTKDGLGGAYRAGFAWGDAAGYDTFVEMDADLSHPAEALPALLAALTDADLVIGSRYVPGGATEGWPWVRKMISRGGNAYVRLALGLDVRDATAGFRVFRAETLRAVDVQSLDSTGYCFQIETAYRSRRAGLRVLERPITFTERELGQSKMSGRIVAEALLRVTWWALTERQIFGRHRSSGGPGGQGAAVRSRARPRVALRDRSSGRVPVLLVALLVLALSGGAVAVASSALAPQEDPSRTSATSALGNPAPSSSTAADAVAEPSTSSRSLSAPAAPHESATTDEPVVDAEAAVPPVQVSIPSIDVQADVGSLGVSDDGTVEVPTDYDDAGWLDTSSPPGERGPAIVLGHVDSKTGLAVFSRLAEVAVGDEVVLTGEDNKPVTYRVTGSGTYPKDDFPTQLVYGPAAGPVLRLITCGGVYDRDAGSHEDNVVVFAVLA